MAQRRKLSISSLSSVAFGCVNLAVGVTVAAGAVAYAAVQVYRGPGVQGDAEKEQTCEDAEATDPAPPPAEATTQPHASDTSTDACNDPESTSPHAHEQAASTAEPTPPDSPLPETPVDMTHAARDEEKTPVRTHTHRRKVSFAPIPETEEAIFVPALAPQEPAALPQQPKQPQDEAPKTNGNGNGAARKKKKSQRKKKTHAQPGSESQDQNALVAA